MPGRKKKCPHCSNFIFVRTRPIDNHRVLVTHEQIEIIEEEWSIVNGTHDQYLAQKRIYDNEKKALAIKFGHEPSENDVQWGLLNKNLIKHTKQHNWGLFRNTKFEMAEILRKESKFEGALGMYLEVCYLDLNGPNNMGGINDPELIKEFPPWNPKDNSFLAPGVVERINRIIKKEGVELTFIYQNFLKRASQLEKSLHLPLSVEKAWKKLETSLLEK